MDRHGAGQDSGTAPVFMGRVFVPVPTGSQSAAFDRRAIESEGVPQPVLMENAGRGAAQVLTRLFPRGTVLVLAGGGNNGGDGVVLARTLQSWGRPVELLSDPGRPNPDPLLHGWEVSGEPIPDGDLRLAARLQAADVVVDALLGTGIRGAPRPAQARVIRAMNDTDRPVLALDIPSGVDADTGAVEGEVVRARATVAFGAPKLGTLLHPGREMSGRLLAVEIGFPPWKNQDVSGRLLTPEWAHRHRPRRPLVTHKNATGRLLLVAGSSRMGGAAVLAARGALRSGVGYLRVAVPEDLRSVLQSSVPEAVQVERDDPGALGEALAASDALAAGPGLGTDPETARLLDGLLAEAGHRPVLLDADALNLLAAGKLTQWDPAGSGPALLTPHPGEAARLLDRSSAEVADDPVQAARELARRYGAAVLLKGAPSVVATPREADPLLISATGSSDLARAGMGDVLTGSAGAFLARGADPAVAGGLALHFTGLAALLAGEGEALLPGSVAEGLVRALATEGAGTSPLELPSLVLDLPRPW